MTIPKKDISGQHFGEWLAVEYVGGKYWKCQCSCGNESEVDGSKLRLGLSTRCRSCSSKKYDANDYGSRLHSIWANMKRRCLTPSTPAYQWYGAKGITICEQWVNDFIAFKLWALSNNYSPSMTIDRKDKLQGYNPDNCQWITLEENSAKSQAEREKSPLNTTGEHHISWNSYKSKYEVTVNHTYVGNYNTIEAAVIERDWFINNHNLQHLAK